MGSFFELVMIWTAREKGLKVRGNGIQGLTNRFLFLDRELETGTTRGDAVYIVNTDADPDANKGKAQFE